MDKKQVFLEEHNKLSPEHLRVTEAMLTRFKAEKSAFFKDTDWSIEKLRRPLIMWLTSLTLGERQALKGKQQTAGGSFQQYPRKTGSSNCSLN